MTIWGKMTSCAIGLEVRVGQKLTSYREFIILNVSMLPLCYSYVIIYAYSTQIMLLQRSSVMLFQSHQSIFYLLKEGGQFDQKDERFGLVNISGGPENSRA